MNKKLWEQFKNGEKIAINCRTEEEAEEFMELCEKHDIKWNSGGNATEDTNWGDRREKTCYTNKFDDCTGLGYAGIKLCKNEGLQIITCTELMGDKKTFTGPELAQAILDGKFKEGTKFKDENNNEYVLALTKVTDEYALMCNYTDFKYATAGALINRTFTLIEEPKEFKFFNQVRNSGKKIKIKSWSEFYDLPEALKIISSYDCNVINDVLNKKLWIEE